MEIISSVSNNLVKAVVKLQTPKGRKEALQFIVEGQRACTTFIENGYDPVFIFITETIQNLPDQLNELEVTQVSGPVMKKMSNAVNPSGFLAVFEIPNNPTFTELSSGLVLSQISDPGNMGTLIRSAAAFGYKSVVVVEGCDPYSSKVLQASAGTLPLVKLFRWSWQELIENKHDLQLIALVAQDGQEPQAVTTPENLFVVGNEAHGIKPEWVKNCDQQITLPMLGNTESLNAAVAGSIVLALQKL
jgi:TrmH family RNA methyltransferase